MSLKFVFILIKFIFLNGKTLLVKFGNFVKMKIGEGRPGKKQMMKRAVRWIYLLHYHLERLRAVKRLQFSKYPR